MCIFLLLFIVLIPVSWCREMVFEQYQVWLFCIPPVSVKIWSYALIKYTWWSSSGWNGTFKWQYQSLFQKLLLTLTLVVTDSTETWDDKWWDEKIIMMTTCQLWWHTMTLGTLVLAILLCRAWAASILLRWKGLMPKIPDAAPRACPIPEENLLEGRGRIHRVGGKHSGRGEEHQLLWKKGRWGGLYVDAQFIKWAEWSAHVTHLVSCPREPPLERGAATGWFERLLVRQGLPPCTRDGRDIGVGLTWGKITRVSVWHQHCHHPVHHTIDHPTNRSCRQDHQYLCLCFCTFFAWGAAGRGLAASWTTPSWWRRMTRRRMA